MATTNMKRTPGRDKSRKRALTQETEAVEVVCRLPPYSGRDPCLKVLGDNYVRCIPPPSLPRRDANAEEKIYEFGHVFNEFDGQKSVFDRCAKDLVQNLVSGKNSLLFTYGVTGSGKTYTMTGKNSSDGAGIIPRTLDVIFNSIDNILPKCFFANTKNEYQVRNKLEAQLYRRLLESESLNLSQEVQDRYNELSRVTGFIDDYVCSVFVTYVEIFKNTCYDLLINDGSDPKKDVRLDSNNMTYVDATEVEVSTADEALEMFCRGDGKRATAATTLNADSSRSHSVFTIKLVLCPIDEDQPGDYPIEDSSRIIVSQLSLVDLAGSERAKRTCNQGERLAEASDINKSLMTLRQCIERLRKNQRSSFKESVPYRESKLTHLFKNYFEGSGKVRMIICANPRPDDYYENLMVMAFAEESQKVKVNVAEELLERDPNRPSIPRSFVNKWGAILDSKCKSNNADSETPIMIDFPLRIKTIEDIERMIVHYDHMDDELAIKAEENAAKLCKFGSDLRHSLCFNDYMKCKNEEYKNEINTQMSTIAELTSKNRQLKRENASLNERVERIEADDDELKANENALWKKGKETEMKLQRKEELLRMARLLCDKDTHTPSVAELKKHFGGDSDKASAPASAKTARGTPSSSSRRPQNIDTPILSTRAPYMNQKYQRRSKSAPRILDHKENHPVPPGVYAQLQFPSNTKSVTRPEFSDIQKSSEYVLTHQSLDNDGNVSTSVVKGNCIPTAGGGTAVQFRDVERISHESPVISRSTRNRSSNRC